MRSSMRNQDLPSDTSVAVLQDWVEPVGGAEKVLREFLDMFDDTHLYSLWNDAPDFHSGPSIESWLASSRLRGKKAASLGLMSRTWRHFPPAQEYDLALISSCAFAHHASIAPPNATFIYAHSPARYIWDRSEDPRGNALANLAVPYLKRLDRKHVQRQAHYAANSEYVAGRIREAWRIDPHVIHPPVDVERIQRIRDWTTELTSTESGILETLPEHFLLAASRLVRYKGVDRVIEAGSQLGLAVVVAGDGPDRMRLESLAAKSGIPVRFLGRVSDELLYSLYQLASTYVFPAVEDFGIMPVEALAAGGRVVGNRSGGASETIKDGVSGYLADPSDLRELVSAIERSQNLDPAAARQRAQKFSRERFVSRILDWIVDLT